LKIGRGVTFRVTNVLLLGAHDAVARRRPPLSWHLLFSRSGPPLSRISCHLVRIGQTRMAKRGAKSPNRTLSIRSIHYVSGPRSVLIAAHGTKFRARNPRNLHTVRRVALSQANMWSSQCGGTETHDRRCPVGVVGSIVAQPHALAAQYRRNPY
jgi:hypothetical protein